MKTDTPRPIRLQDYRPPAYLIDTVDLDFTLDTTRTRVRARLALRPNPQASGKSGEPLRLDGEQLELGEVRLDGKRLQSTDYKVDDTSLTLARVPKRFVTSGKGEPFTRGKKSAGPPAAMTRRWISASSRSGSTSTGTRTSSPARSSSARKVGRSAGAVAEKSAMGALS